MMIHLSSKARPTVGGWIVALCGKKVEPQQASNVVATCPECERRELIREKHEWDNRMGDD